MQHTSLRWLAGLGLAFALGFGLAWMVRAPVPAAIPALAVAAQAPAGEPAFGGAWQPGAAAIAPAAAPPGNASVAQLWSRALGPDGFAAEDQLRKLAQSNPVALRELLQRYSSGQPAQERELLKGILSTVQKPDVVAFAARLAASSNLAERTLGFELLHSVAPDAPETHSLVKRTLASEQAPEVLLQALATLRPGTAEPEEADQIVAQLMSLSQHAEPSVRSQSIAQLAQWDKKGEAAGRLAQALADSAPEVRQAAVFAVAQSGTRNDALKAALIAMLGNPQESRDNRGSALMALERFALSKDEHAQVVRAKAQLAAR